MNTEDLTKSEKLNETLDKILLKTKSVCPKGCKTGKCGKKNKSTCFDKELVEQVDKKLVLEDGRQLLL